MYVRWKKSKDQAEATLKSKGGNGGKRGTAVDKERGKDADAKPGGEQRDEREVRVNGDDAKREHDEHMDDGGGEERKSSDDLTEKDDDQDRKKPGGSADDGQLDERGSWPGDGEDGGKETHEEERQAGNKRGRHGRGLDATPCSLAQGQLMLAKYKSTSQWYECVLVAQVEGGKWFVQVCSLPSLSSFCLFCAFLSCDSNDCSGRTAMSKTP